MHDLFTRVYQMSKPIVLALLGVVLLQQCGTLESDDIPTNPDTLAGFIQQGQESFAAGNFEEAVEKFNLGLERNVDPGEALAAYQGLGWSYSRIGKPGLALNNFSFILSIESLISGKTPVVEREGVRAVSRPANLAFADTFGIGPWSVALDPSDYLLSVSGISSYSAEYLQKITVGSLPGKVQPGTDILVLDKGPISNLAGDSLGTATASSLVFTPDTLVSPLTSPDDIVTYSQYYLDVTAGEVTIKPRYWVLENLEAEFNYYEDNYAPLNFDLHLIALQETVGEDDFPVLDAGTYTGGMIFYIAGEFFNPVDGGTYNMADAYAGMTAAFLSQESFHETIQAALTAILINEFLEDNDPGNYPYERQLYQGDTEVGMWEIYHMLASAYLNIKDFRNTLTTLGQLGATELELPDPASASFVFDALNLLGTFQEPAEWLPPPIW